MKPLTSSNNLLTRIDNATNGEIRSLTVKSPSSIVVILSVQDMGREYDWINIAFEVSGITDAHLVDENRLSFLDMSEGVSIFIDKTQVGFGIGRCSNISNIKDLPLYLLGTSMKYEELNFSE